jgi:hypothetical protein
VQPIGRLAFYGDDPRQVVALLRGRLLTAER